MIAQSFGHAGHGWLQHLLWWWEIRSGTVNPSGPYYSALSGWVGDVALLGSFVSLVALLVHAVKSHQCHETTCHRIATHEYEMDGVKHRVCHHHHPALGPEHKLTSVALRAHHAAKQKPIAFMQSGDVSTTAKTGNSTAGAVRVVVQRPTPSARKPARDAAGRFAKKQK